MLRVGVLISGGGSNLQSLIDFAANRDRAGYEICAVISDREAHGLERADKAGIPNWLIDRKSGVKSLADDIYEILKERVDCIVLAGFLSILDSSFIDKWQGKIINIHPALLPAFGGKGMYGMNVHRAVIESGAAESGCTVHFVDAGIDTGKIIGQMRLDIDKSWDAVRLQKEVLKLEHKLLPETLKELSSKGGNR